jgi:hypothetical protein
LEWCKLTTHLVIGDQHAHYQHNNERATWLSKLIIDLQPDAVINIGDAADMPSLSGYDRGKKSFQGRTYRADIDSHLDFQQRLWEPVIKRKKRLPQRVFLIGNHEDRITRAIDLQPELDGAIGLKDLELERYYQDVVYYDGRHPGNICIDGVYYAHYFVNGGSGRAISSEHQGNALLAKRHASCTVGHNHRLDYCSHATANGTRIHGLSVGCFLDFDLPFAGESNKLWWRGIVIKHNVEGGQYDAEFVSLDRLRKEYGN